MFWWAMAAAGAAAASSASSASSAAKQASKLSIAENEAVIEANVKNTIRTGYRVGLMNMQRGLQKRQMVQQSYDITKQGKEALGQVTANAAASGTIGASADAVLNDVQMKVGEAQATLVNQNEIDATNFNTQLEGVVFEGTQAIQKERKANIQSDSSIMGNALFAGATSFASTYMMGKLKLGAGGAVGSGSYSPWAGSLGAGASNNLTSPTGQIWN